MTQYTAYRSSFSGGGPTARPFAFPRITWMVRLLILANVCVFTLQLLLDIPFGNRYSVYTPGGPFNDFFSFQASRFLSGHVHTPISYQFLHGGLLHLFMNMLWLFFFGPDVERALGSRQFLRFYLLCGALGVLVNVATFALFGRDPGITGASGAAMGVMVAFAVLDPDRQFFLFPLPFPINARALVLIVVVLNVITAMGQTNTSVATHFGGMAAGYALMKALPRYTAWRLRRRHERAARRKRENLDRVGEAVDNIFKFKDHDPR